MVTKVSRVAREVLIPIVTHPLYSLRSKSKDFIFIQYYKAPHSLGRHFWENWFLTKFKGQSPAPTHKLAEFLPANHKGYLCRLLWWGSVPLWPFNCLLFR